MPPPPAHILGLAAAGLAPAAGPRPPRLGLGRGRGVHSSPGVIRGVRLGNPHGELDVEADDGLWTAEIGQPYRNEQAGLTEGPSPSAPRSPSKATARATRTRG